jgi:prolyl-tRNA synthetase
VHGDDKGLRFPWKIAPVQIVIIPIRDDEKIIKKANELKLELEKFASVEIDLTDKSPGEKFNHWEMKGVPIRIDLGLKDMENKSLTVFRRDLNKKESINEKEFLRNVLDIAKDYDANLIKQADSVFENRVKDVSTKLELKKAIEEGNVARGGFCSVDMDGAACAGIIEKEIMATVRGTKLVKEKASGKCVICGKKADEVVYVARQY